MRWTISVALAAVLLMPGCRSGPSRREIREAKAAAREAREAMQQDFARQVDMFMKVAKQYQGIGVASISLVPAGGTVWVDGGEYVGKDGDMVLPVGPHEFSAVWDDRKSTNRTIYIEPALKTWTFNYEHNETESSLRVRSGSKGPEIYKTPVALRPD